MVTPPPPKMIDIFAKLMTCWSTDRCDVVNFSQHQLGRGWDVEFQTQLTTGIFIYVFRGSFMLKIGKKTHGLLVWKPNWISNKIQRKCRHFNRKKLAKKFSLDFQIVIRILFFKIEKKLDEISHWLLVWKQNRISNKIQTKISKFQYKEIRQEIKRRLSNEKAIRIGLLQKKKSWDRSFTSTTFLLIDLIFFLIWKI